MFAIFESNLFCMISIFVYQVFSSFIYCRYPVVLENLNSSNSENKVCSYYIVYLIPRACFVSCNLEKNATISELFVFFFWHFTTNKRRPFFYYLFIYISYSIQCFLFHAFFYSNKILLIADILQTLKF